MTDFEINLLNSLNELNEMLLNTKDVDLVKVIKRDIINIQNLLEEFKIAKFSVPHEQSNINKKIVDNYERLTKIIIYNNYFNANIRKFKLSKKINDFDSAKIFFDFLDNNEFELKPIYNFLINHNAISFTTKKRNYIGCTFHIKTLNRNYIEICDSENIYGTLVHELGHASQNLNSQNISYHTNLLSETYSIFLELIYADYYKKFGFNQESFNMKIRILNSCSSQAKLLYDSLDHCNSYYFKYQIKKFLGTLLAIYLYNEYSNNKIKGKEQVDILNKYIKSTNEEELLNKMGLSLDEFEKNHVLYDFSGKLIKEKAKIKLKK